MSPEEAKQTLLSWADAHDARATALKRSPMANAALLGTGVVVAALAMRRLGRPVRRVASAALVIRALPWIASAARAAWTFRGLTRAQP